MNFLALISVISLAFCSSHYGQVEEAKAFEKGQVFVNGIGQKMIWVAPGNFCMGDVAGDGADDERPVRKVELSGYHLAATEVTQSQWQQVMETTVEKQAEKALQDDTSYPEFSGNTLRGLMKIPRDGGDHRLLLEGTGADLPMYWVSWEEAADFCRRLTEAEHKAGRLPEGHAFQLPTEAQWENACRSGTQEAYAGELDAMAWYAGSSEMKMAPVAGKQPNTWGFFDMHGSVWEWCRDWYADTYTGLQTQDPEGPEDGRYRVYRGGSWGAAAADCRSASRTGFTPTNRNGGLGFRVAVSPVPTGENP